MVWTSLGYLATDNRICRRRNYSGFPLEYTEAYILLLLVITVVSFYTYVTWHLSCVHHSLKSQHCEQSGSSKRIGAEVWLNRSTIS